MNRDELDVMRQIVEKSVKDTDDYINWTFVDMVRKETEDDQNGNDRGRPDSNMVG